MSNAELITLYIEEELPVYGLPDITPWAIPVSTAYAVPAALPKFVKPRSWWRRLFRYA